MPKAFISYARDGGHGENLATEIQQQLQAAGFAVFRDVTGLKPGDPWFHKLEFELETSDVMVLVLSEKVRKSKWVHNEFSMVEEIGIPVIPGLAEVIRQPLWVRHLQILDFCGARDWRALFEAVGIPSSFSRYLTHNNGAVMEDTLTGLMWKRCSEGQSSVDACSGYPDLYRWDDAMSKFGKDVRFAGYNDWRIPTIEELKTLVDKSQMPAINQTVFPNTPGYWYWSSTVKNASNAWNVYFGTGYDSWNDCNDRYHVRLIRSGQ